MSWVPSWGDKEKSGSAVQHPKVAIANRGIDTNAWSGAGVGDECSGVLPKQTTAI